MLKANEGHDEAIEKGGNSEHDQARQTNDPTFTETSLTNQNASKSLVSMRQPDFQGTMAGSQTFNLNSNLTNCSSDI